MNRDTVLVVRQTNPLHLALVALLVAVGLYITLRSVGWFTMVPGDVGDPRFNSVVLEHLFLVVTTGESLWDVDFYYPFPGILALSDNHLGSGGPYVAARLAGLGREHAFDVWYIAGFLANFTAALYALRRFGLDLVAAAVGAFVFTWGLPILAQDGHAQLVYRFCVPMAALALWRAFQRRDILGFASVAVWTAWQFFCSIYVGIFLLYLLAAMTVVLLLNRRPLELGSWLSGWRSASVRPKLVFILIVVFVGLGMAWLLGTYLAASQRYGLARPLDVITSMLPRWASYFNSQRVHYLAGLTRELNIPTVHEQQMFIGVVASALAVVGAVASLARRTPQSTVGILAVWALFILILGTLWVRGFSLYYMIAWLPGINSVRAVARVIVVMLLPMGMLAGIGVTVLAALAARNRAATIAVTATLVGMLCIEPFTLGRGSTLVSIWRERIETVRAALPDTLPADPILLVRTAATDVTELIRMNLDAMVLAQDMGIPTLNGYSGYSPPGRNLSDSCATVEEALASWGWFSAMDIAPYVTRVVVVDLPPTCPAP